ncbi:hypothetical protein KJ611_00750 [Patescibacteria group bacterium]|nr:hypothetical protein [Patescibacteria group bacterium]MBU1705583.1 hypothetical protein [Patescibacteria group bacterium]
MPAKKTAAAKGGKSPKKKTQTKKPSGTCSVCSAGVKPLMATCDDCGPQAMLKMADEPMPGPKIETVQSCNNCDHVPGRVNAVIGLLAVVIVVLAVTVLASVMIISSQAFQIEAFNSAGGIIDNLVRK